MKILVALTSWKNTEKRLLACLSTWVNNIRSPHEYFIAGDDYLCSKYNKCQVCSPYTGENYASLPIKTLNTIDYALKYKDFDLLYKCDDDTYVMFDRMIKLLQSLDNIQNIYFGYNAGRNPRYATGASYIISKNIIQYHYDIISKHLKSDDTAEDRCIGRAMEEANIPLTSIQSINKNLFVRLNGLEPERHTYAINQILKHDSIWAVMQRQSEIYMKTIHDQVSI